jgi:hypothetical protein
MNNSRNIGALRLAVVALVLVLADTAADYLKRDIVAKQVIKVQHFTFSPKLPMKILSYAVILSALAYFIFSRSPSDHTLDAAVLGGLLYAFHGVSHIYYFKHGSPIFALGETFYGASLFMLLTDVYNFSK